MRYFLIIAGIGVIRRGPCDSPQNRHGLRSEFLPQHRGQSRGHAGNNALHRRTCDCQTCRHKGQIGPVVARQRTCGGKDLNAIELHILCGRIKAVLGRHALNRAQQYRCRDRQFRHR